MILTVGHSTRALVEFLRLLEHHQVDVLVDVRAYPASRRHPHFCLAPLSDALARVHVEYRHHPDLGGRRAPDGRPRNAGLRNPRFRGFADYMQTPAFDSALAGLLDVTADPHRQVAIMCAEAVPWRCHRNLITDALLARGEVVEHIIDLGPARPARLSVDARVTDGHVQYPAACGAQEVLL